MYDKIKANLDKLEGFKAKLAKKAILSKTTNFE